jgi:hypothetical protein
VSAGPREGEKQVRVHLWLYASDAVWLRETFGDTMGISKPVRLMVRKLRQNAEARAAQAPGSAPRDDLREAMNDAGL